ncbi:MAG: vWA domain-containing protein [Isosphaeraceae bacterium]
MTNMQFVHPGWFWLMVLVPIPWLLERLRPRVIWPGFEGFSAGRRPGWIWLRALPPWLRGLAIAALAVALARPQTVGGVTRIAGQGVAIVVILDQSSSMKARDFPADRGTRTITRLEAAQTTFKRFVEGRPDDLIGALAFANYPNLICPPTLDHAFLGENIEAIRPARPGEDGTNIGDAIIEGLDAVLVAPPRKKVLVLLTDGNNEPAVPRPYDPVAAATLARDWGVILYTIAVGQTGGILRGVDPKTDQPAMAEVAGPNLPLLKQMAELTGGSAFTATDADALADVFKRIDELEKSPVRGRILTRYDEHYAPWAGLALTLLVLDRLLAQGRLRRMP